MMVMLTGFIYSFIIIKVAPRMFDGGFNKKNMVKVYSLFALIHFSLLIVFQEKLVHELIYISIAVGFLGLIGSVVYKLVEDKYGK